MASFSQNKSTRRVRRSTVHTVQANKRHGYDFNQLLDVSYLRDFYDNDWATAATMFDLFLQSTVKTCQQIFQSYRAQHFRQFQQLIHKVRASFKMVGLGKVDDLLERLERSNEVQLKSQEAYHLLQQFQLTIEQYIPIIKREAQRLAALA